MKLENRMWCADIIVITRKFCTENGWTWRNALIAMTRHYVVTTDKHLVGPLTISHSNHYGQQQVTKLYNSWFIITACSLSRNSIIYRKSRLDNDILFSYKSPRNLYTFKVCKSVHHRTIQTDHQPDATIFQFIILTFIYSSTCFRPPAHHQGRVFVVGPAGPTTNTARLSPRYEGKTGGCYRSRWAPDDGRGERPKHVET